MMSRPLSALLVCAPVVLLGCSAEVDDLFQNSGGSGQGGLGQGGSGQNSSSSVTGTSQTSTSQTSTSQTSTSQTGTSSVATSTSTGQTTNQVSSSSGGPVCPNGIQEPGEACDGADLNGASCLDFGYVNPAGVVCTGQCALNYDACEPICGNGVLEPDEACDDGNLIDGDGCSSMCAVTGTTCMGAIAVSLPLGLTILSGTTIGGTDVFTPAQSNGCPDGSGPERVYAVTPSQNGFLTAWLPNAATNFDSVLYARGDCVDSASQVLCDDNFGTPGNNGGEVVSFPVLAGNPVFLFVDGFSGDEGAYDLQLDLSVGEDCNDPVPITIEGQGSISARGSTAGFTSQVACGTGQGAGPDVVYAVTVTDADNYSFNVNAGYNSVLNLRSTCGDVFSQVGCSSPQGNNSSVNNLMINSGSTVYTWVDGTSGESGTYTLSISH